MTKKQNSKLYYLEDRTFHYTKKVIAFINEIPKSLTNIELSRQLIRSARSVGAKYIETNEALSKKDFVMRI